MTAGISRGGSDRASQAAISRGAKSGGEIFIHIDGSSRG
jgi:hypothetical protein